MSNDTLKNIGYALIGILCTIIYQLIVDHTKLELANMAISNIEAKNEAHVIQIEELKAQVMRLNLFVEQHQDWILRVQNKAEAALDEAQKHEH